MDDPVDVADSSAVAGGIGDAHQAAQRRWLVKLVALGDEADGARLDHLAYPESIAVVGYFRFSPATGFLSFGFLAFLTFFLPFVPIFSLRTALVPCTGVFYTGAGTGSNLISPVRPDPHYNHRVRLLRLFAELLKGSPSSASSSSTSRQKFSASPPVTTAFSCASLSATG